MTGIAGFAWFATIVIYAQAAVYGSRLGTMVMAGVMGVAQATFFILLLGMPAGLIAGWISGIFFITLINGLKFCLRQGD